MRPQLKQEQQELSREIIEKINELQERIGDISVRIKQDRVLGGIVGSAQIEELEKKQLEISGFESLEKMHKAIGRFFKGNLQFLELWRYDEGFLFNHLSQQIGWLSHGGDWLEQMYYMRLLIEILEDRPYGQGLYSHVPEEKDEKKSDEGKAVQVGDYHVWSGEKKDVNYSVNIKLGIYLFEIMEILEDNGFVVTVVDPAHVREACYFSEDFQSIREVHWTGYLHLRVNVRKYSKYHKDSKITLHV